MRRHRIFPGHRIIMGIPATSVTTTDPRYRPFMDATARLVVTTDALVLNTSSVADLSASCSAGLGYLCSSLRRSPNRIRWIDCGRFWTFRDSQGSQVRSAEHLYQSIEHLLACTTTERTNVFLIRPGSPFVGDELCRLWMERHGSRLCTYDAPSPLEQAADAVESLLRPARRRERIHLAASTFAELTPLQTRRLRGLLILRSMDDTYAHFPKQGDLVFRTFRQIRRAFPDTLCSYLCHIGQEQYVVACRLTDLPRKWDLFDRVVHPWTIVIARD